MIFEVPCHEYRTKSFLKGGLGESLVRLYWFFYSITWWLIMHGLGIQGIRRWIQGSAKLQSWGKKTIGRRRVPDMGNHRRSMEQFWWTPSCKENIQASKFLVLCFLKLANRSPCSSSFVSDLLSCGNGSRHIDRTNEHIVYDARLLFCKNKKHWNS